MKIYIDVVMIINYFIDMFILISLGYLLKRKINIKLIAISSFIGSIGLLTIFIIDNNVLLNINKLLLSIIMIIISYPKLSLKYFLYNFITFYILSIMLGGTIYFIYENFYSNKYILLLFSPLFIYIFIKCIKIFINRSNNYYLTSIYINDEVISGYGFLDTGFNLTYKGKPIIITKYNYESDNYKILPYKVINKTLFLKIYRSNKIVINNKEYKNMYFGVCNDINIDGVDMLLNFKIMEDI